MDNVVLTKALVLCTTVTQETVSFSADYRKTTNPCIRRLHCPFQTRAWTISVVTDDKLVKSDVAIQTGTVAPLTPTCRLVMKIQIPP